MTLYSTFGRIDIFKKFVLKYVDMEYLYICLLNCLQHSFIIFTEDVLHISDRATQSALTISRKAWSSQNLSRVARGQNGKAGRLPSPNG